MLAILLILMQAQTVQSMDMEQIDRELSVSIGLAQANHLLHRLTHHVCGESVRQQKITEITERYERVERQFYALGGQSIQQNLTVEAYHTDCTKNGLFADMSAWATVSDQVEREIDRMDALLSRKQILMAGSPDESSAPAR
jgi:hypothetical protein